MNKLFYPAIFHREGDGFWVTFPDFPECFTEGDNMELAYEMAVELKADLNEGKNWYELK